MVPRSCVKNLANKINNYWLKIHTFLLENYRTIYKLKDIVYLNLPGFDKKQIIKVLSKEIENCSLKSKPLIILIIEIDFFKYYVETFGNEAGKNLINSVREIIDKKIRGSDLCYNDAKGKFIIFLPEAMQEEVLKIASRVRDIVTKQGYSPNNRTEQIKIKLTVSIGSAYTHCKEGNYKIQSFRLLKKAQLSLLEGQKKGINQINLGD